MMIGHATPTGTSVLDELDLDPAWIVKAKLAARIHKSIVEMGLTQREAAARMPITQPKLSLSCAASWTTSARRSWSSASGRWATIS